MTDVDERKRLLRAEIRSRIPKPASDEAIAASAAAQERLLCAPLMAEANVVGLYRALPSECGTAALAVALEAQGKQICYPVIAGGGRVLRFCRSAGTFAAGALGVEEPTGAAVPLDRIELLVVPAVAVDPAGHRIGRGGGYYDATLSAFRGRSVALIFDAQLVPRVPVGEHDQRVGAVCTESRFFVCV